MTVSELQSLQSFKIYNEHGTIKFIPAKNSSGIDLTEVDLA